MWTGTTSLLVTLYDDSTFVEESQDFESIDMHVLELADLIDKVQIE